VRRVRTCVHKRKVDVASHMNVTEWDRTRSEVTFPWCRDMDTMPSPPYLSERVRDEDVAL